MRRHSEEDEQGCKLSFWFFLLHLLRESWRFCWLQTFKMVSCSLWAFLLPPCTEGGPSGVQEDRLGLARKWHTPNQSCELAQGKNFAAPLFLAWLASFNLMTFLPLHFSSSQLCPLLCSSWLYRLLGQRWCLRSTPVTGFMENRESLSTSFWLYLYQHLLSLAVMISWALSPPPGANVGQFFSPLLHSQWLCFFLVSPCAICLLPSIRGRLLTTEWIYMSAYFLQIQMSWILPQTILV